MMIAELVSVLLTVGMADPGMRAPMYRPADRSVSNWRLQSLRHLDLDVSTVLTIGSGRDPARLPRCIKLNNYWCIKSARWNGEIATDQEGHVGFSSAREGASVAVALLRRYYLDLGRTSALSIVSRWAPAQCGLPVASSAARRVVSRGRSAAKGSAGPASSRADSLATRGIGNTLRARFLAGRGRGAVKTARRPVVRSTIPYRPISMMRAPSIASGMGEREVKLAPLTLASLGTISAVLPSLSGSGGRDATPALPRSSCANDTLRIRNYATSIIQGLGKSIDDDLMLFEPNGAPTPNLARAMTNMAAVEIGPFRAGQPLIADVIASALRSAEAKKEAKDKEAQNGAAPQAIR